MKLNFRKYKIFTILITALLLSISGFSQKIPLKNAFLRNDFDGNGQNILNLNSITATIENIVTMNVTNLNLYGNLVFRTNSVADVTIIDLSVPYAHTNHTANFTIAGFANVDTSYTNYAFATRCYTNNSSGTKTITFPSTFQDIGNQGNPVYNTNIGVLSVWVIFGFSTNYLWVGK
jgi:hypothetical protein